MAVAAQLPEQTVAPCGGGVSGPVPVLAAPTSVSPRKSARLAGRPLGGLMIRASARKALLREGRVAVLREEPRVAIKERSTMCGIHLSDAEAGDFLLCAGASI